MYTVIDGPKDIAKVVGEGRRRQGDALDASRHAIHFAVLNYHSIGGTCCYCCLKKNQNAPRPSVVVLLLAATRADEKKKKKKTNKQNRERGIDCY